MPLLMPAVFNSFFYQPDRDWNICPDFFTEEITLTAPDGIKIVCLYIQSAAVKKSGAVFLLHGRAGNASRYSYYAKPLVREGFDVFIADWRGYGKSQGRPDHNNVAEDSKLALQYFFSRTGASQKKILWGLSLGGQVAIHLAKGFAGDFTALVTEGAISSFHRAAADYYHKALKIPFQLFVQKPYSAEHDIKETSRLPKLIIHSTEDKEISFKNAEILYQNASEPKVLLKIKGNHLYGLNRQNAPHYIREFKRMARVA